MQLLTDAQDPDALFADPLFCCEQKMDGDRRIVTKTGNIVTEITRGDNVSLLDSGTVLNVALWSDHDFTIDGEMMPGGNFIAFDILELNGLDLTGLAQGARRDILEAVCPFPLVLRAIGEDAKRELFEKVKRQKGEGVVFKDVRSTYRHQRNSDWLRWKLYQRDPFTVRSIDPATGSLEVEREGQSFGKVPHKLCEVYAIGQTVEVRYDAITAKGKLLRGRLV